MPLDHHVFGLHIYNHLYFFLFHLFLCFLDGTFQGKSELSALDIPEDRLARLVAASGSRTIVVTDSRPLQYPPAEYTWLVQPLETVAVPSAAKSDAISFSRTTGSASSKTAWLMSGQVNKPAVNYHPGRVRLPCAFSVVAAG